MTKGKEIKNRLMTLSQVFNYVPEKERFLSAEIEPKYKFNIIGMGIIGQEHMRLTAIEGRASIHGVYDPNPGSIESAKRTFSFAAPDSELIIYDSLEQACHDPDVDGLILCTPNYTHIDVVRVAAQSGKHILLEKPMATTIPDAYEIKQIADKYPAIFQIGLQYRFKAMYVEAIHEVLERKSIGDVKLINISEHRLPFLDKVNQWNKFSEYSGGTLVEKCCHFFDLLNLFAQSRPKRVFATGSMAVNFLDFEHKGKKSDILDNAFVTVDYENGVRAGFNLCMFSSMFFEEIVVCGDEGRLSGFENEDFMPGPRIKTQLEISRGENFPSRKSTPSYPTFLESSGHSGSTFVEHVAFMNQIEGIPTSTASAEEGFWSIVVGAAAEESVKTGQPVMVDELLKQNGLNPSVL
jgi:myo-inositol 2-dehydrogenase / D-chiro-inositol 1-dehydrogenase